VNITEDRSFERFMAQLDEADQEELKHFVEHGTWPEEVSVAGWRS